MLKMMCVVGAVVETSFLGKWEDGNDGLVTVTLGKRVESFFARVERRGNQIRDVPVRLDSHGRSMCGKALQRHEISQDQIVWQPGAGFARWVWCRTEETSFVQEQQVMRFCETLQLMEASKEPVVVPVRALCFTCNINEKMKFRHRRGCMTYIAWKHRSTRRR